MPKTLAICRRKCYNDCNCKLANYTYRVAGRNNTKTTEIPGLGGDETGMTEDEELKNLLMGDDDPKAPPMEEDFDALMARLDDMLNPDPQPEEPQPEEPLSEEFQPEETQSEEEQPEETQSEETPPEEPQPEEPLSEEPQPAEGQPEETLPEGACPAERTDTPENCRQWAMFHLNLARQYWQAAGETGELPGLAQPEAAAPPEKQKQAPPRKKRRWVWELLFYLVLIMVVLGTFAVKVSSGDTPMSVGGYSVFTVLTGSMQKEIPQGSLIVTRHDDPSTLQVGDTITYMASQNTTITHRVIGIIEDYQGTGMRAFETQGVMNDTPDKLPVPAVNVIGKVIFHNYALGRAATFIGNYWMYVVIFLVLFWGLAIAVKSFFRKA